MDERIEIKTRGKARKNIVHQRYAYIDYPDLVSYKCLGAVDLTGRPAVSKAVKAVTRLRGSSIASSQAIAQQPSRKPSSTFQPREREIVGATYT